MSISYWVIFWNSWFGWLCCGHRPQKSSPLYCNLFHGHRCWWSMQKWRNFMVHTISKQSFKTRRRLHVSFIFSTFYRNRCCLANIFRNNSFFKKQWNWRWGLGLLVYVYDKASEYRCISSGQVTASFIIISSAIYLTEYLDVAILYR